MNDLSERPLNIRRILSFLILLILASCASEGRAEENALDYRHEMRKFVGEISRYGNERHPGFLVIPQNGQELMTYEGTADGTVVQSYVSSIDGVGREDLFYGYRDDNEATPEAERNYMLGFLDLAKSLGIRVLTIDYCSSPGKMDDSYRRNSRRDYISLAADHRSLDNIPSYPPEPFRGNDGSVGSLSEAANFLYLINPRLFVSSEEMVRALEKSSYDILIIDLFDNDGRILPLQAVERLKKKPGGSSRLVIAYMSIGEAEDYRYYWREEWNRRKPSWLDRENPGWPGNYKVRYWDSRWKEVIFGGEESYLDLILGRNFDGVYLDLIDAFEYYE